MLKFLLSCYMRFFLRNITTLICTPFFPNNLPRYLVAFIPWKILLHHKHCQFFIKPQNVIIILYRWNEIKLSFGFCTCLLLIQKQMKCWIRLACGRRRERNINDINWGKNPTCKKWKSFRSKTGKKEDTLANKTATLTEKKRLIYIFLN